MVGSTKKTLIEHHKMQDIYTADDEVTSLHIAS